MQLLVMADVATKRSTVYLENDLHRALKIKSAETSNSVSELINDAVRDSLSEDLADLKACEDRANEPTISYEAMLKALKLDGKL